MKAKMDMKRVIGLLCGLVCVVIGAAFLICAHQAKDGFREKVRKKLTGSYTKNVRNYTITGIVFVVVGAGALVYFGFRKK